MKTWLVGSLIAWGVAATGLGLYTLWGFSPIQRSVIRSELEAELAAVVPNPAVFGHPLLHFYIAAEWLDPDHRVRWHTLPANMVWRALRDFFPTPLLAFAIRIGVIAIAQALLAAAVLWAAIRLACEGGRAVPFAPLGRPPKGR